jgi:hypothetical protein
MTSISGVTGGGGGGFSGGGGGFSGAGGGRGGGGFPPQHIPVQQFKFRVSFDNRC